MNSVKKPKDDLENKMEKMQESINKNLEDLKNKHTETNNTITEIKNILEGINSRISEAEEQISELEDKMVEITSEEQNKVKRMKQQQGSLVCCSRWGRKESDKSEQLNNNITQSWEKQQTEKVGL